LAFSRNNDDILPVLLLTEIKSAIIHESSTWSVELLYLASSLSEIPFNVGVCNVWSMMCSDGEELLLLLTCSPLSVIVLLFEMVNSVVYVIIIIIINCCNWICIIVAVDGNVLKGHIFFWPLLLILLLLSCLMQLLVVTDVCIWFGRNCRLHSCTWKLFWDVAMILYGIIHMGTCMCAFMYHSSAVKVQVWSWKFANISLCKCVCSSLYLLVLLDSINIGLLFFYFWQALLYVYILLYALMCEYCLYQPLCWYVFLQCYDERTVQIWSPILSHCHVTNF